MDFYSLCVADGDLSYSSCCVCIYRFSSGRMKGFTGTKKKVVGKIPEMESKCEELINCRSKVCAERKGAGRPGMVGGVLLAGLVKGCLYPGVWARCLVETVENLLWHR